MYRHRWHKMFQQIIDMETSRAGMPEEEDGNVTLC